MAGRGRRSAVPVTEHEAGLDAPVLAARHRWRRRAPRRGSDEQAREAAVAATADGSGAAGAPLRADAARHRVAASAPAACSWLHRGAGTNVARAHHQRHHPPRPRPGRRLLCRVRRLLPGGQRPAGDEPVRAAPQPPFPPGRRRGRGPPAAITAVEARGGGGAPGRRDRRGARRPREAADPGHRHPHLGPLRAPHPLPAQRLSPPLGHGGLP